MKLVLLLALTASCTRTERAQRTVQPADLERAHARATALKQTLMTELTMAIGKGVPAAIDVCHTRAPAIAAELSRDGVVVGRATRRARNPQNRATGWKDDAIEELAAKHARGEPLATARFTRVLSDGRIVYAEPLVVAELCVSCHGTQVADDVKAAIAARYPEDQATGYAVGDLRGIVWVELGLDEKPAP
jgi:hypothetical protein